MGNVCNKCGEKNVKEFYKDMSRKNGLSRWCKKCYRNHSKKYYLKNTEILKQKSQQYHSENIEKCHQNTKQYYLKNKEYFKQKGKQFYLKNPGYAKKSSKNYRLKNPENVKKYKLANREKSNQYEKNRRKTDVNYKILINCRARINQALKNNFKSSRTSNLVMCSISQLRFHIEKQFLSGMTWDNYGLGKNNWQIDHIIPCSFFNMLDAVEQYMCFRWQNLQPLWQPDNQAKSDKVSQ